MFESCDDVIIVAVDLDRATVGGKSQKSHMVKMTFTLEVNQQTGQLPE